ncbi:MAG TPA: 2-phospho-L-lactate guanylyltransferase [Thermoleophilaceae bacterium]|nr:2-phospho-L-lactate guanylyltransferase [Thermoleophilaceae bacterium]
MRTLAVLPVKSFGAAKQRLAGALGTGAREALAQAMFADVLSALRRVPQIHGIAVVTGDRRAQAAAAGDRVTVIDDPADAGHSEAAMLGVERALAEGYERVLLVPGDTPLLDAREVGAVLDAAAADGTGLLVVPDRHGTGTNALLISPPDAIAPSFGPGSLDRHQDLARVAGISHRVEPVESLLHDVDTADDLAALGAALGARRGLAGCTRGTLNQLGRAGAVPALAH